MDHYHVNHRLTGLWQKLIVFTQAAVAVEPAEGALHNPPFRQEEETLGPRLTISRRTFRQGRSAPSQATRSPAYA
jgi:hypothetical protein